MKTLAIGEMTDAEIRRELTEATGERRDQLQAEMTERRRIRASGEIHYTY